MAGTRTMERTAGVLQGEHVRLRPVSAEDYEEIAQLIEDPQVKRWWSLYDMERVRAAAMGQRVGVYAIEAEGQVIGAIEYVENAEPDYRHAQVDLFVSHDRWGEGVGSDAVRTLTRSLFEDQGHHRVVSAPATKNERGIQFYEKVGFKPVGVLHQYERQPDGSWEDCLLMELLEDDFKG